MHLLLCYNPYSCIQVIIRHEVGVPGLKRALILLLFLLPASLMWLSCGGSSSTFGTGTSGVAYRAFITNNVSAGTLSPGVYIVDAANDVRATASPISAGNTPGMMVVTPNRTQTLVFSGDGTPSSDNQFTIINNAKESVFAHLTLPGMTESFVVSPDSSTAYVALPTAQVTGQPDSGVIEVISLSSGTMTAEIYCPIANTANLVCAWPAGVGTGFNAPYTYLSMGNTGNRILAFSQPSASDSTADVVAVITPSSINTSNPVVTFVTGFDHPVWAYFNADDTTAYVLNCGAECGGTQASIQQLNLTDNTLGPSVPVCTPGASPQCAGSVALVNGSTMYVAGTPVPASPCTGQTTAATSCGLLTIVDLSTMSVTNTAPIIITDGYHDRIALGANGQLFIGSNTCTEIVPPIPPPPGAEVRGCLSIYNTLATAVGSASAGGVVIPPANGDVTGLQPIAKRGSKMAQQVVYVVQGGSLSIYDTMIDALEYNPNNSKNPGQISSLIGNFIDVKTVDF